MGRVTGASTGQVGLGWVQIASLLSGSGRVGSGPTNYVGLCTLNLLNRV